MAILTKGLIYRAVKVKPDTVSTRSGRQDVSIFTSVAEAAASTAGAAAAAAASL